MTRVAYLINAYKNPAQVERLARRLLLGAGTAVFIHLDRSSGNEIEAELRRALAGVPEVRFVPRLTVRWGRFSVVAAALRGFDAIERSGLDPDQTVLLSGQDYPIKPPEQIAGFLSAHAGAAFMEHYPIPNQELMPVQRGGLDRVEYVHMWVPRRGPTKLPLRRRRPLGLAPFGGSAHWALGRAHRLYLGELRRSDPRLIRFFRWCDVPDELFFQTLLLNSPLRESVINDNLFELRWGRYLNHPDYFEPDDIELLRDSTALFARKFDSGRDPEMLSLIDRELLGITP